MLILPAESKSEVNYTWCAQGPHKRTRMGDAVGEKGKWERNNHFISNENISTFNIYKKNYI
jgi:hypothetical protein